MAFTGKTFLNGINNLDNPERERYSRHGTYRDGRWHFIEQIVDEAMLRMARAHEDGADGE